MLRHNSSRREQGSSTWRVCLDDSERRFDDGRVTGVEDKDDEDDSEEGESLNFMALDAFLLEFMEVAEVVVLVLVLSSLFTTSLPGVHKICK